jgi:hypothetical protein
LVLSLVTVAVRVTGELPELIVVLVPDCVIDTLVAGWLPPQALNSKVRLIAKARQIPRRVFMAQALRYG